MAGSLLRATNHKATNDLALWLYIYRDEGLTATSEALLFLAILSNLPVIRVNRSFTYNAANDYIGEASYDMFCPLYLYIIKLVCRHMPGGLWLSTAKPIRV